MLEFTRMVRSWQWHLMVFQFCRPVWRRFVSEAILSGAWTPPEGVSMRDVMRCRWDMPARGYINPLQEVAAYIQAVAAGFTSQERGANELGNESAEIDIENARAKARAEAAGLSYTVFNPQNAGAAAVAGWWVRPRPRLLPNTDWKFPSRSASHAAATLRLWTDVGSDPSQRRTGRKPSPALGPPNSSPPE